MEKMKKDCSNCRYFGTEREWYLPLGGILEFKCNSKSRCYHWEEKPTPTAFTIKSTKDGFSIQKTQD